MKWKCCYHNHWTHGTTAEEATAEEASCYILLPSNSQGATCCSTSYNSSTPLDVITPLGKAVNVVKYLYINNNIGIFLFLGIYIVHCVVHIVKNPAAVIYLLPESNLLIDITCMHTYMFTFCHCSLSISDMHRWSESYASRGCMASPSPAHSVCKN